MLDSRQLCQGMACYGADGLDLAFPVVSMTGRLYYLVSCLPVSENAQTAPQPGDAHHRIRRLDD